MKKTILLILLLSITILFSGCEIIWFMFYVKGMCNPEDSWNGHFPLEEGEYWIYECDITENEKVDGLIVDSESYTRRDSVVVLGEDETSDSRLAIHVVDYWTCKGDNGEIHHYYIQQSDGLYNLATRYLNGIDLDSETRNPKFQHHVELSPLPGHAVIQRPGFAEDTEFLESPMRKVLNSSYWENNQFTGTAEWGEYFDKYSVSNGFETYRIWNCMGVDKRYWIPDTWIIKMRVYDYICDDGIVKREMSVDYREILDEDGNGTGVYKKYVATFRLVDGTYLH